MEITKAYYCPKCEQWSKEQICQNCKNKAEEKDLPLRRDEFYFINGISIPLPAVNSIINLISKPWLIKWAAKEGARAVIKNPFISIDDAVRSVDNIKIEAARKGSLVHKVIENPEEYKNLTAEEKKLINPFIKAYNKFLADNVVETLFKERTIYSQKYKYAGTLDRVIKMNNNTTALIDFKTSHLMNEVSLSLQLSAYKQALKELEPQLVIDRMLGVHLKENETYSLVEVEDSFKIFKALLVTYRWLYKFE